MPDQFDAELNGYTALRRQKRKQQKKSSKLKSAEVASLYTLRWTVSLNIVGSKSCNQLQVLLFLKR